MAVRLERKLFCFFKYFILLIPIFLILGNYLTTYFNYKSQYDLVNNNEYLSWFENIEGFPYYEDMVGAPDLKQISYTEMNLINSYLPQFTVTINNRTYTSNLFVCIYSVVNNNGVSGLNTMYIILTYLSYFVMIELVFLCLKLFRFFIFFFENLFERKEDIVK